MDAWDDDKLRSELAERLNRPLPEVERLCGHAMRMYLNACAHDYDLFEMSQAVSCEARDDKYGCARLYSRVLDDYKRMLRGHH